MTTGVKAILVASSHEKFSSLILATEGGMLEQWIQDPDTTDWITKTINIPSLSEVAKVKVYYTEVTVMDENNLPVAGAVRLVASMV